MQILPVLSAVFFIACHGTGARPDTTAVDTGSVPSGGELQLRTHKDSYRAGEQMLLTLVNPTDDGYTYNPCTRSLEREVSGRWIELEEMRMCTMIAHILAPRSSRTERTELAGGLEPGRYRVVLLLSRERRGGADPVRLSAPITVPR